MPKYGLIACFSPVIKVELVNICLMGTGSQKLGVGKWKEIRVLAIQKVANFDKHGLAFFPTHIQFGPIQRLQSIRQIINF